MKESPRVRILVLRGGAIGDFVLTLPALQCLRERWPEAHIELIGYPHIANLALAGGLVDRVDSLDRAEIARFFSFRPEFSDAQKEHLASFHFVLSYLHDPDGLVRDNLLLAGAQQVLYGSPLVQAGHAADHLLKPLEDLAIYGEGRVPRLVLDGDQAGVGRRLLAARGIQSPALLLHPGSGGSHKRWPVDRYIALARRAPETGRAVAFLAGEADADLIETLGAQASDLPVIHQLNLMDLAAVLLSGRPYVGNDSGITHLAAALGVPVVALFGPTDPNQWGPRGSNVRILRAPEGRWEALGVDKVLAALITAADEAPQSDP